MRSCTTASSPTRRSPHRRRRPARADQAQAAVAQPHELHPQALSEPAAIVPIARDLLLVPRARLRFSREDLADPSGEPTLLRLDDVPNDLVRAPFLGIEVPGGIVAKSEKLRLDECAARLEIGRDLLRRELPRIGHQPTSWGALRSEERRVGKEGSAG